MQLVFVGRRSVNMCGGCCCRSWRTSCGLVHGVKTHRCIRWLVRDRTRHCQTYFESCRFGVRSSPLVLVSRHERLDHKPLRAPIAHASLACGFHMDRSTPRRVMFFIDPPTAGVPVDAYTGIRASAFTRLPVYRSTRERVSAETAKKRDHDFLLPQVFSCGTSGRVPVNACSGGRVCANPREREGAETSCENTRASR